MVDDESEALQRTPVNEPFLQGRECSRLIFDLGVMFSCLKDNPNKKVLDFGAGSCWISEWLNRMGYEVTAFDVSQDVLNIGKKRVECDKRIAMQRMSFVDGDGHSMPFKDNTFSHICCYDTLHHMHDYEKVFSEFSRILVPGGRIIFVEPGSEHSRSKETIEFIERFKKHDPTWIERDVNISEINELGKRFGFTEMRLKPFLLPSQVNYSFNDWFHFRDNKAGKENHINLLLEFNNRSRVIFYMDKK